MRLEKPRNYLVGSTFEPPLSPQNVVLFNRRSESALVMGAKFRQHHHRYVLMTALRGAGEMCIDTQLFFIEEGQSVLVHPFQTHWYNYLSKASIHWLFITFEHGKDSRLDSLRDIGPIGSREDDLELLLAFLKSWQSPTHHSLASMRLAEMLHHLSLQPKLTEKEAPAEATKTASETTERGTWLAGINSYIFENRKTTFSVADLAQHLKISTSQLRVKFRSTTGKAIGKYVRELRLQYSCELLHGTKLQIGNIAELCGYDSAFSFTRAFTKTYHISPTAYRKRYFAVNAGDVKRPANRRRSKPTSSEEINSRTP